MAALAYNHAVSIDQYEDEGVLGLYNVASELVSVGRSRGVHRP